MNTIKEKILFLRVKIKKDTDAFGELYDIYVDKIYRFIYFKVSSKEEAEDLTSEVFLKAWQYISNEKNSKKIENFKALLYKIARNSVIDFYRKRSQKIKKEVEIDYTLQDKKNLEKDIEVNFDFIQVEKAMAELKGEYKDVIILKYIEGFSVNDISNIVGKSNVAVRVMLHRALKALKEILKDY